MPSGSKKRKAARKKKEKQPNNHPDPSSATTHSHGDDVKHQDDKDIDVGDLSSPASQDHHSHQNLLTDGEEEEIEMEKNISNLPSMKGLEIENYEEPSIVVEEDCVVQVERVFEIEDESEKKNGTIVLDEPARKSYDGGSSESSGSNSSSTNSDDESHGIKNSQAVVDVVPVVDSLNAADSLSGRSAETILSATTEEAGDSVVGNFPAVDLEKISSISEKAVDMSSPAYNSVACYVVESVFTENGEKMQSSFEDKVSISAALMDASSKRNEEEAIIQSVENTVTVSDPKECVTQENDDRLTPSDSAPRADADNGVEHEKDSGVTENLIMNCFERLCMCKDGKDFLFVIIFFIKAQVMSEEQQARNRLMHSRSSRIMLKAAKGWFL